MIERVIIAGGGTGGHLFPGIAVVEELRRRNPEVAVCFVGTARGIEARLLPGRGEHLELLDVQPLKGQGPAKTMLSMAKLPKSAAQALALVRRFRPQVVIGLGGYASGPMLAAAAAVRVPTAILEQNAHVGLTNRMLANVVGRAYLTYEQTVGVFGARRSRLLGNPVRRDFVDVANMGALDPMGEDARANQILVIGGSQGARCLNEVVPQALATAGETVRGVTVTHQTGASMVDAVSARYAELGLEANVVPFIDDMARAYRSASLVIGRAGATTLAEVCAIGRASILIPFPFAAEDHQMKNAAALQEKGAAVALAEAALTPALLAGHVQRLLGDRPARAEMAHAARLLGRPDAAANIVDDLHEWLGLPSGFGAAGNSNPRVSGTHSPADDPSVHRSSQAARRAKVRRSRLRVQPVHVAGLASATLQGQQSDSAIGRTAGLVPALQNMVG